MKLHCPDCASLVKALDVDLFEGLADCRECQRRFPFEALLAPPRLRTRQRPAVAQPAGFERHGEGKRLTLAWTCLQPGLYLYLIVFGLIWNGLLAGGYHQAFSTDDRLWIALTLIFTLPHLLTGLFFIYLPLAALPGRTVITASPQELRMHHGPLPLPWLSHRIATAEIAQLFCRPRKRYRRADQTHYELCVWLKNGHEVLLANVPQAQQAIWLEQQLEAHLGIRDRAVAGEVLG